MRRVSIILALAMCAGAGLLWASTFTYPRPSNNGISVYPGTPVAHYELMRTVTANDTPLTAVTCYWDAIESTWFAIPDTWSRCELAFLAYGDGSTSTGDPNTGTCKVTVYAARYFSDAVQVWQGEVTIGGLEPSVLPWTGDQINAGTDRKSVV
jgi:hypothetical protein